MSNNKWMDDPVLEGISNEKLEMLTKIIEGAKGIEPKQMLTYFIQQSNAAGKQGINFTNSETDLILNVLKEGMTPEEIKRIDTVKRIMAMLEKNKRTGKNSKWQEFLIVYGISIVSFNEQPKIRPALFFTNAGLILLSKSQKNRPGVNELINSMTAFFVIYSLYII